jgi:hypothetical protein
LNRKKIGVTLLVCAILASGLVAAGMVATNGLATDGSSDASSTDSTVTQTLNVTVYADVQGQTVPIEGANVTVYEVTVVQNDTVETITIEKIAVTTTGVGGVAQIALPEGNYTMVADYYGLRSVGILSSDTTGNITMVLGSERCGHDHRYGQPAQISENNTNAINLGGAAFGELNTCLTNETSGNTIPATNAILANGSSVGSMGSPQRRH